MIADAGGAMDALKFDADQQLFWASLGAAAAVAHGRHSAEGGPRVESREINELENRLAALEKANAKGASREHKYNA